MNCIDCSAEMIEYKTNPWGVGYECPICGLRIWTPTSLTKKNPAHVLRKPYYRNNWKPLKEERLRVEKVTFT